MVAFKAALDRMQTMGIATLSLCQWLCAVGMAVQPLNLVMISLVRFVQAAAAAAIKHMSWLQ